jgi:hypothetical protein
MDRGRRESYPAWTDSNIDRSATVRAIGPITPIDGSQTSRASDGTSPKLVRKPKTGGITKTAAIIATVSYGQHPQRERNGSPTAASAC